MAFTEGFLWSIQKDKENVWHIWKAFYGVYGRIRKDKETYGAYGEFIMEDMEG